jgi:hypothetical protein
VEALEATRSATRVEDLKTGEQHNAINPYAKLTFPRAREESRSSEIEHGVTSGVRVGGN